MHTSNQVLHCPSAFNALTCYLVAIWSIHVPSTTALLLPKDDTVTVIIHCTLPLPRCLNHSLKMLKSQLFYPLLLADTELESDVTFLRDVLLKNYKELSTFDKWSSEVHSGALRCSTAPLYSSSFTSALLLSLPLSLLLSLLLSPLL